MIHTEVIKLITEATRDVPGIRTLFLGGSYGNGLADKFSDIDFVLVADQGPTDQIAEIWCNAVAQTGEIVLCWDRIKIPALINIITEDWTRTDVYILKPNQMNYQTQSALKPLFDHDGIYDQLAKTAHKIEPNPSKFKHQVEEFIRIIGLLHLAAGRKEYINGVLGVFHLRNLLVDLLIEETGAPNRGGILHLNRLITDEQKELIASLPPADANLDGMITSHLACAKAYLPRARARAALLGVEWPEAFEVATWKQLKETLSIERPY